MNLEVHIITMKLFMAAKTTVSLRYLLPFLVDFHNDFVERRKPASLRTRLEVPSTFSCKLSQC